MAVTGASSLLQRTVIAGDIDLDLELRNMLSPSRGEWGHWGVLRVFDLSQRSSWWDETSNEAINGPAYQFVDYLVRMRRVYAPVNEAELTMKPSYQSYYKNVFYLASNVRPKKEDILIEIAESEWQSTPSPVNYRRFHNIEYPDTKLDGKFIYTKVYTSYMTPIRDESVNNPMFVNNTLATLL